jgi:DNA-binding NtrC family response regulator
MYALPAGRIRLVLYEEARDRTCGSPGRPSSLGFHPPSLTSPNVRAPQQVAATALRCALVVDDEPTIRTAVARYLRRRGWKADEAEDGRTALAKLDRASPDGYQVVISDLRMPHYSGVQLHDWLEQHRPDLFARLILTTGDLGSPALSEFLTRTPRPVIEKPFELAVLFQLIEAVLQGR